PHDSSDLHSFPTRRSSDLSLAQDFFFMLEFFTHLTKRDLLLLLIISSCRPQPQDPVLPALFRALAENKIQHTRAYEYGKDQNNKDRKSTRLNSSHVAISYA